MNEIVDRGYCVKENGPIYYTKDMDRALKWFQDTLGWYGRIIDRREDGTGDYGFVADLPEEIVVSHTVPFQGIHMWYGEPLNKTFALIQVEGLDSLYKYVRQNGWDQISDIQNPGWCSGICSITTPDGAVITFYE